jgi:hypothetical protein
MNVSRSPRDLVGRPGRPGRPEEVARIGHFLAAAASSWVTGGGWVNGGWICRRARSVARDWPRSIELILAWVLETLRSLADDDDHNASLRETLQVFLKEGGSFKTTAERLTVHKNTVQYRIRKAEESLGRPVDADHLQIELALLASHWLGAAVLRQPAGQRAGRP